MICCALESITIHSQEVSANSVHHSVDVNEPYHSQSNQILVLTPQTDSILRFLFKASHPPAHPLPQSIWELEGRAWYATPTKDHLSHFALAWRVAKSCECVLPWSLLLGFTGRQRELTLGWSTLSPGIPRVAISACSSYYGFWLKNGQTFLSLALCSLWLFLGHSYIQIPQITE